MLLLIGNVSNPGKDFISIEHIEIFCIWVWVGVRVRVRLWAVWGCICDIDMRPTPSHPR
jgi:hypothetical protein